MTSRIPLVDVLAANKSLGDELPQAVQRVLASGRYIQGEETKKFEAAFASYCGVNEAIAVDSGTAAIHLALLAVGLKPGDEVLTSPFTFVATGTAILHAGLKPAFADIQPGGFNLDPAKIEEALTPRTRAIMPVHLFGSAADMTAITAIAKKRGLAVVEDACQAHGAIHAGRRAGSFGDASTFSFYPSKNLAAIGDGGAITTNREDVSRDVRLRRDHGRTSKYEHGVVGYNYRMDEFQAAALALKLPRLDGWNDKRRALAARYHGALEGLPVARPAPDERSAWHLYVIRTPKREALREKLAADGIETGVHYPLPLHLQPPFRDLGYAKGRFPESEHAADEVLTLPMYPELGNEGVDRVVSAVRGFFLGSRL